MTNPPSHKRKIAYLKCADIDVNQGQTQPRSPDRLPLSLPQQLRQLGDTVRDLPQKTNPKRGVLGVVASLGF
jgi:hypothetical protein